MGLQPEAENPEPGASSNPRAGDRGRAIPKPSVGFAVPGDQANNLGSGFSVTRLLKAPSPSIEPIARPWDGRGDPLSYVISKNLHRRHLNESQRAMVAAKIATLTHGGDRANQYVGGKRPIGPLPQSEAAKLLNVGETSLKRAARVRDGGIKELQQGPATSPFGPPIKSPGNHKRSKEVIVSRGEKAIREAAATAKAQKCPPWAGTKGTSVQGPHVGRHVGNKAHPIAVALALQ